MGVCVFLVVISIASGLGRRGTRRGGGEGGREGMNKSSAETQGHLESLNQWQANGFTKRSVDEEEGGWGGGEGGLGGGGGVRLGGAGAAKSSATSTYDMWSGCYVNIIVARRCFYFNTTEQIHKRSLFFFFFFFFKMLIFVFFLYSIGGPLSNQSELHLFFKLPSNPWLDMAHIQRRAMSHPTIPIPFVPLSFRMSLVWMWQ